MYKLGCTIPVGFPNPFAWRRCALLLRSLIAARDNLFFFLGTQLVVSSMKINTNNTCMHGLLNQMLQLLLSCCYWCFLQYPIDFFIYEYDSWNLNLLASAVTCQGSALVTCYETMRLMQICSRLHVALKTPT